MSSSNVSLTHDAPGVYTLKFPTNIYAPPTADAFVDDNLLILRQPSIVDTDDYGTLWCDMWSGSTDAYEVRVKVTLQIQCAAPGFNLSMKL